MSLKDPIDVHLELAKKDLDAGITGDLSAMTVAGILSLIPGAGSAIQSLLDGKARANVERRWIYMRAGAKLGHSAPRERCPAAE